MDLGLGDKAAVVLASTSGLGLASARALLREGAAVAISGRDEARLARAQRELGEHGERLFAARLDVTDRAALEAQDRKITRLNSSHSQISYAVFCLKKKTGPISPSSVTPASRSSPYSTILCAVTRPPCPPALRRST